MWLGPAPVIPYMGQALDDRWAGMPDYAVGFLSTWGVHHSDIAQWGHDTELTGPVEIEGKGDYLNVEFCNMPMNGGRNARCGWRETDPLQRGEGAGSFAG